VAGSRPRIIVTTEDHSPAPAPADDADSLRLDQFLKLCALADSGGRAKFLIQGGEVKVNGQVETRRRRKLVHGDVVEVGGQAVEVHDSEKEE